MVLVRVVLPPCSTRTSVPTASPGYHASSNFSVLTIRSGALISRYTPPIPISVPLRSCRHTKRYLPPTRRSISHPGIDQPGGPSSHRLTSSGLVWASNTNWHGASNTRVITISRSPGAVSCNVAALFIGGLLVFFGWVATDRADRRGAGTCAPKTGGSAPAIGWLPRAAWPRAVGAVAAHRGRAK